MKDITFETWLASVNCCIPAGTVSTSREVLAAKAAWQAARKDQAAIYAKGVADGRKAMATDLRELLGITNETS